MNGFESYPQPRGSDFLPVFVELAIALLTVTLAFRFAAQMLESEAPAAERFQIGWLPDSKRRELANKYGVQAAARAELIIPESEGPEAAEEAAKKLHEIWKEECLGLSPPSLPEQKKGVLKIASEPEGAEFGVTGPESFKGKTPFEKEVKPGRYTITWKALDEHETPKPETVEISAEATVEVRGVYTPIPRGVIKVTSEPEGMEFTIKGPLGTEKHATPWTSPKVPPGEYEVIWSRAEGHMRPKTERKTLEPGGVLEFRGVYRRMKLASLNSLEEGKKEEVKSDLEAKMAEFLEMSPAAKERPDEDLAEDLMVWAEEKGISLPREEALEMARRAKEKAKCGI